MSVEYFTWKFIKDYMMQIGKKKQQNILNYYISIKIGIFLCSV